jgi:hypothetical protein
MFFLLVAVYILEYLAKANKKKESSSNLNN